MPVDGAINVVFRLDPTQALSVLMMIQSESRIVASGIKMGKVRLDELKKKHDDLSWSLFDNIVHMNHQIRDLSVAMHIMLNKIPMISNKIKNHLRPMLIGITDQTMNVSKQMSVLKEQHDRFMRKFNEDLVRIKSETTRQIVTTQRMITMMGQVTHVFSGAFGFWANAASSMAQSYIVIANAISMMGAATGMGWIIPIMGAITGTLAMVTTGVTAVANQDKADQFQGSLGNLYHQTEDIS